MRRRVLFISVLTTLFLVLSTSLVMAGRPPKVDVCHSTGSGKYILINISERALPAHLAHGDGLPGDPVPGMDGMIFGPDCSVQSAPLSGYGVIESALLFYGDGGWAGWSVPADKVVLGGGFDAEVPVAASAPATPGSVWPHYIFGADEYGWVVQDAPDGAGSTTTVYAVFADMPAGYEVVSSPALAFGDGGYGGWSCPAGKVVVGGGFEATGPVVVSAPGTSGSVWPHYTFGADEYGWVVRDAQDGVPNTITIYAVCASMPAGYEVVNSPALSFSDTGYGGWSCPAGKVVTGGGFEATAPVAVSAPGTPGSVWPHYTFGTDEYGWVVRDAPDGTGSTTTVYAVCTDSP
jgi:hypothetical protein